MQRLFWQTRIVLCSKGKWQKHFHWSSRHSCLGKCLVWKVNICEKTVTPHSWTQMLVDPCKNTHCLALLHAGLFGFRGMKNLQRPSWRKWLNFMHRRKRRLKRETKKRWFWLNYPAFINFIGPTLSWNILKIIVSLPKIDFTVTP